MENCRRDSRNRPGRTQDEVVQEEGRTGGGKAILGRQELFGRPSLENGH